MGKVAGGGGSRGFGRTIRVRKGRAFEAYLELLETADWFRRTLRGQLEIFDLTIEGFRLMELLHRRGPMTVAEICQLRRCERESLFTVMRTLQKRECVDYEVRRHPVSDSRAADKSRLRRSAPSRGKQFGVLRLSAEGEKLIAEVIPRHMKVVFAFMTALDAREQDHLVRVCRKLREGNVVKFLHEMEMEG